MDYTTRLSLNSGERMLVGGFWGAKRLNGARRAVNDYCIPLDSRMAAMGKVH